MILLLYVVHVYMLQNQYIAIIINLYNFMFIKENDKRKKSMHRIRYIQFDYLPFLVS